MLSWKPMFDPASNERVLPTSLSGVELLSNPVFNKGSAFTQEERAEFGLDGLLPPHVGSLEEQLERRYRDYCQFDTNIERHIDLRALQDRNETLFYALLKRHIAEMMPLVYTPVVGAACEHFSHIYRRHRGLFIAYPDRGRIGSILENRPFREVDVIVVTDGERILGLGDQGVGGMGIPVGKLSLYSLCGGIHPSRTLPVLLDTGTDNQERIADPLYLGWRHERLRGPAYDELVEAFVSAVERKLPGALVQWEDFGQTNARRLLERYRERLCTFNDDLQGTAAVALAALLGASHATGLPLEQQRIVIVGAGSAGTGISDLLILAQRRAGLNDAEARARLWLVDRAGLLHTNMPGLLGFQEKYAQPSERVAGWKRDAQGHIALEEVIRQVRPTALIGVSGQPGLFTQPLVRLMAEQVARPVILPLSNPTSRCEAVAGDLLTWTDGRAIVATGSPATAVDSAGRTFAVDQCNNAYIFPGIGLGVIATKARRVTEKLFVAAAEALAGCAPARLDPAGRLFPPIEEIRGVSRRIAIAVATAALAEGLAARESDRSAEELVDDAWWEPEYYMMKRVT